MNILFLKKSLLILFCLFICQLSKAERSMYVDDFANILNDAGLKTNLLEYAEANEITYLLFYELHLVHNEHDLTNPATNQILADFLADAKQNYGITKVAATSENAWYFENRIIAYNESRTNADEKFDVLGMEFEFWTPVFIEPGGYYCTNYLTPNGYSCDNAGAYAFCKGELEAIRILADNSTHPMTVEIYVGWPDATQLLEIADIVDRTFIHAYVPDPNNAFGYAEGRLEYYENYVGTAEITIIFSAEPNFSGPWLQNNNMAMAEQVFMEDYNASTGTWKSNIDLQGFTYFTYTMMSDVVLPINEGNSEDDEASIDEKETQVKVFPNPTNDRIYIKSKRVRQPFELRNQLGQTIQQGLFLPEFIDISEYSSSIYFLHLQGEILRIVKN